MTRSERAQRALGFSRLVNGGIALVAPRFLTRTFGLDEKAEGPALYVLRLFGVRTVVLGIALLCGKGGEQDVRNALFIHASDAVAAIGAGVGGQLPPRAAGTAALLSGANTILAAVARGSR